MPDYSKYWDDSAPVEAPKALPSGHYAATVTGVELKTTRDKGDGTPPRPMGRVVMKLESAEDDAIDNGADPAKVRGRVVSTNFFPDTDDGRYQIEQFAAETCGIDTAGLGQKEKLEATKGSPVKVFLGPPRTYNGREQEDVKKVLAA